MGILPDTATEERIGFNELRENAIFSTDNAPSDEKKPSSRRTTRPPTRKHHLLDDGTSRGEDESIRRSIRKITRTASNPRRRSPSIGETSRDDFPRSATARPTRTTPHSR